MFEKATRQKLRFQYKGLISTEDLWDLSLEELNAIYVALCSKTKNKTEDSLITDGKASKEDRDNMLRMEIVKSIFEVKKKEVEKRKLKKEQKDRDQQILSILAHKENQEMENKSIDELRAMLNKDDEEEEE
jgi:hypothetical protein